MKKKLCIMVLFFFTLLLFSGCGAEKRPEGDIVKELALYHAAYGEEADQKVQELLKELRKVDKEDGQKWERIMEYWDSLEEEMPLHYDVLPDGLSDTDELCIVALGFQLSLDGEMTEELIGRLEVVKRSAEKYPNALIVCTGGGTAAENKEVTEAGKMAEWLIQNGIAPERVIIEDHSITTAQNAMFSYDILVNDYPKVTQLAIISSDYHIATGELLFTAEAVLKADQAGEERMQVVSNAAYKAQTGTLSELFQAGALIELSGDNRTAFDIYHNTYDIRELPPLK